MTFYAVNQPFEIFHDLNGDPLEAGYIWIGEVNQNPITHPINVTWDAGGLYPAAQPIRTSAGYANRSGSPGNIYIDAAQSQSYSMVIKNKNNELIYYSQDVISDTFAKTAQVDSIAQLMDISSFNYSVYVRGHQTIGDGGQGNFEWSSNDHASDVSADPSMGIFVPSNNDLTGASGCWKRSVSGKVLIIWFNPDISGVNSSVEAVTSAINYCKNNGYKTIWANNGTYKIDSVLPNLNSDFDSITIVGENADQVIFDVSDLAAEEPCFKASGGSGSLTKGFVSDLTIKGNGIQTGIENVGLCGWCFYRLKFKNLQYGNVFSNDLSGAFTEYSIAYDCDYASDVITPFFYKRGAGNDSFHGSGFRRCTINNGSGITDPTVQIGASTDASRLVVYNAPMDAQIWTRNTYNIINVKSGIGSIVTSHGTITIERFTGNCTIGAGETIYHAGNVLEWAAGYWYLGTMKLVEWATPIFDGSINYLSKPYRKYQVNDSTDSIDILTADNIGTLAFVFFLTDNYIYQYLISVASSNFDSTGVYSIVATLIINNTAGLGAPTFSISNGILTATNPNWVGHNVSARIHVLGDGGRFNYFDYGF